jgi:hypothetical protein
MILTKFYKEGRNEVKTVLIIHVFTCLEYRTEGIVLRCMMESQPTTHRIGV